MINTIIFDLEGVVIASEKFWTIELEQWFARLGIDYSDAEVKSKASGHSVYEGAAIIMDYCGIPGDRFQAARDRIASMKSLLEEVEFIPGFETFYEQVRRDYKTAVGSSIDKELLEVVDSRLNVKTMFNGHIYTVEDAGNIGKPDPAIFLYAAGKIGSRPENCIVIEDSPSGLQAAKNAGMNSIGIATTYPIDLLKDATYRVKSFSEIDMARVCRFL